MKKLFFEIVKIDEGFCRIVFKTKNKNDEDIFYCLQEEFFNSPLVLYRCCKMFEPCSVVTLPREHNCVFDMPQGITLLQIKAIEWIKLKRAV